MTSIYDVSQQELVEALAEELKKIDDFKPPEWGKFIKTGHSKQRPPVKEDWWYSRVASVMKNLYRKGPIGVSKLRSIYGCKKNRGVKPGKFYKSGGNIIRKVLQQLEAAGFAKQVTIDAHKGRVLTPKGKSIMDKVAQSIRKPAEKKVMPKKEKAEVKEEPKEAAPKKEEKATEKKEAPKKADKKEKKEPKEKKTKKSEAKEKEKKEESKEEVASEEDKA